MDDLKTKDLIFIGETHFNTIHEKNEETILRELFKTKKFNLAVESLSDSPEYQRIQKIIDSSVPRGPLFLSPQNQPMAKALEVIISKEIPTVVIMGSLHLKDCRSVDNLIRENYPNISSVVILQEDDFSIGIYEVRTSLYKDYVLVGSLKTT